MKSLKLGNGTIKRYHDLEAEKLVKNGAAMYVSKTEWRNYIYGLDESIKKEFPANVEGSKEFNQVNEKDRKEEEKIKKAEKEARKKEYAQRKQEKSHKK